MEQLPGDSMPALNWVSGMLWSTALTKDKLELGCWQSVLHSALSELPNLAAQSRKQESNTLDSLTRPLREESYLFYVM